jgi:hypothetical protein
MEFRGNYLQCVLQQQTVAVSVFDERGNVREVTPLEASTMSLSQGCVGIGHQKRIRYIRPECLCIGWFGGNHTIRRLPVRNERGEATTAPIIEHKPLVYSRPQG